MSLITPVFYYKNLRKEFLLMEKIRFLNNLNVYDGEVSVRRNVVAIKFIDTLPPQSTLTNGFELLNENNGLVQGNYTAYTTIYRTYEDNSMLIELSNDGSIYTPPVIPDPEPEPYVPTYEEILNNKISELSSICQCTIEAGLTIGNSHYSYTKEDQINLGDITDMVKLTKLPLGYHADSEGCGEHSAEELINIYIQLAKNKYCQQTYFNQSREYLQTLDESETNRQIIESYTYGTPLTGIYLENYNNMVALYDAQVQALLNIMSENEK